MSKIAKENIVEYNAADIMRENIGNYAYSVILARMFPSVYDGLKPVARKILYAMKLNGFDSTKPHKKCLGIIGATSSYYVHGDMSMFNALVKLGQDFYMNVPLIDGNGNYGSISGDRSSAARYLEARLSKYAETFLDGISKNAVDMKPNYDNSKEEPVVLPVQFPNLLINGNFGIATGFISYIPPHNFEEVCQAVIDIIDNPDISLDEIVSKIRPDFPTGGTIINSNDLTEIYKKGHGVIRLRARIKIKDEKHLIISEVPFMKTVCDIKERIQELVLNGTIKGIRDIHDNTNKKNGVSIDIKLGNSVDPRVIKNQLYKLTDLETSIKVSLIAVNKDNFKMYNIKSLLVEWLDFRRNTLKRIFNFEINRIRKRLHIIEGLLIALSNIDEVVKIIKKSSSMEDSKINLIKRFKLTEIQADYIVNIKLYQLTKLQINDLKNEKKDLENTLKDKISYFENHNKLDSYIKNELKNGIKKYGCERKTRLKNISSKIDEKLLVSNYKCLIMMTKNGFIKKIKENIKSQSLNTQGKQLGKIRDNDTLVKTLYTENYDNLFVFTNKGLVYKVKIYEVMECALNSLGTRLDNYIKLEPNEKIINIITLTDDQLNSDNSYLTFLTKDGYIKKTILNKYTKISKSGLIAIRLKENDLLVDILYEDKDTNYVIVTKKGYMNKFSSKEITPSMRTALGYIGIKLSKDDETISLMFNDDEDILFISEKGKGKICKTIETSKRLGKNSLIKIGNEEKLLEAFSINKDNKYLILISNKKINSINIEDIKTYPRISSKCQPLMKLDKDDRIVDCVCN